MATDAPVHERLDDRYTGAQIIDDEINKFVDLYLRDYIHYWYALLCAALGVLPSVCGCWQGWCVSYLRVLVDLGRLSLSELCALVVMGVAGRFNVRHHDYMHNKLLSYTNG